MSALGMLLLALQANAPVLSARVDRAEVTQGEIVTLTIQVATDGGAAVQIIDPILSGLEMAGFREQTSVSIVNGVARREITRILRLAARTAGTAVIGGVRARQGEVVSETDPIRITVRPAGSPSAALAPVVRGLVERSVPPPGGPEDVAVRVVTLPETLTVGGQVDLVTLAWFPREVRSRLRTPPMLEPPSASGAWVYERATPSGIVASRQVDGRWYDLFVNHQVVFPLVPGRLAVENAVVRYRVPLTYSFLSRELEHVVVSDSVAVLVRPFPEAGRPAGFSGTAARDFALTLTADDSVLGGRSTRVHATMTGTGNVALWPEPAIAWPAGLRVYPGDVETTVTSPEGRIGGTKRFTWLVVADSGGRLDVPPVRHPWFDLASGRYRVAETATLRLAAPPPPAVAGPSAPEPLPLLRPRATLADRVAAVPPWTAVVVLLGPPLLLVLIPMARRLRRRAPAARAPGALEHLEQTFRTTVAQLVPASEASDAHRLEVALRAAGVEPALAQHAARVGERLRGAVFGPQDALDAAELGAEVEAVLAALRAQAGRHTRGVVGVVTLLLCLLPAAGVAQSAEQLFDAGAWQAAADSFLARAAAEPGRAAHWYNAGVALEAAGRPGHAWIAWRKAARLAPRHDVIGRALERAPADEYTERLAPVWPVRPEELWFAAALLWLGGWTLVAVRRRLAGALVLGVAMVAGGTGVLERNAYARELAFALTEEVPLREAPYGPAPAPRVLPQGAAAEVIRVEGRWVLVARGAARGWVMLGDVARL